LLRQAVHRIEIRTRGKGFTDFTREVEKWVGESGIQNGLLTLFCQHTSASLLIQENADPDVVRDLTDYFERIAPENDPHYRHTLEGPDDMPAHIKTALTSTQLSIPVIGGETALGTWQGIYLFEHRSHPHRRTIALHLLGE
jgi:secondary thiamine-phosphate synthase enzyme